MAVAGVFIFYSAILFVAISHLQLPRRFAPRLQNEGEFGRLSATT